MNRIAFALVLSSTASCVIDGVGGPRVDAVEPGAIVNATDVSVVVRGRFPLEAHANLDDPSAVSAPDQFAVRLFSEGHADVSLLSVVRVDEESLEAVVPAGVAPATWSIRVIDPRGSSATRAGALRVMAPCIFDADCNDGDPCTTSERCESTGCVSGERDLDADGDGFVAAACGGLDCEDDPLGCGADCNPDEHEGPSAAAECSDGMDNDCDGDSDASDLTCTLNCAPASIDSDSSFIVTATIGTSSSGSLGGGVLRTQHGDGVEARGLLRFDFSSLPPSAQVVKAKLKVHRESATGLPLVAVHEATSAWTASEVTWTDAALGSPWAIAGGDFSAQAVDSAPITSANVIWDVTPSVEAWVSGSRVNHGFFLNADPSALLPFEARFSAGDSRLTLDYCLP